MNKIESAVFKIAGIRPESEDVKWYSIVTLAAFAKIDQLRNGTRFEGDILPALGPAFVVLNHRNYFDIARGYVLCEKSHRLFKTFAKHTLFDPKAEESGKVKERTGRKSDLLNLGSGSNRFKLAFANIISAIVRGAEAMPVERGGSLKEIRKFLKKAKDEFDKKRIVAMLAQGTRTEDGRLNDPMKGPEIVAMENPDVPIYSVSMAKRHVGVRRLGSYNELCENPKYSRLAETNLTVLIFDAIADISDPEVKKDWYEVQRPALLPPTLSIKSQPETLQPLRP